MSCHITSEVLIQYYSGLVTMLNDVRVIWNRQNNFGIAVLPDPFSKGLVHARLTVYSGGFFGIFVTSSQCTMKGKVVPMLNTITLWHMTMFFTAE